MEEREGGQSVRRVRRPRRVRASIHLDMHRPTHQSFSRRCPSHSIHRSTSIDFSPQLCCIRTHLEFGGEVVDIARVDQLPPVDCRGGVCCWSGVSCASWMVSGLGGQESQRGGNRGLTEGGGEERVVPVQHYAGLLVCERPDHLPGRALAAGRRAGGRERGADARGGHLGMEEEGCAVRLGDVKEGRAAVRRLQQGVRRLEWCLHAGCHDGCCCEGEEAEVAPCGCVLARVLLLLLLCCSSNNQRDRGDSRTVCAAAACTRTPPCCCLPVCVWICVGYCESGGPGIPSWTAVSNAQRSSTPPCCLMKPERGSV